MDHEQIPADRPHLKVALRFNSLEVCEKAGGQRVDCQDTKREDADIDESTVYHWAAPRFRRIFKGLCKGVAASGFVLSRGSNRRKIGNRFLLRPLF